MSIMSEVSHPAYVHVNLDVITNNVNLLQKCATNPNIGMIAMVKANAYGHGLITVARHLKSLGVERLGVANIQEAKDLRKEGIQGPIHVFANVQGWEMPACIEYNLIPTISTREAGTALVQLVQQRTKKPSVEECVCVHIKVDTGMCRNGCQPNQLDEIIQTCSVEGVKVEGIFTHMADFENVDFTDKQMDIFKKAVEPYRNKGILLHVANSGCILNGIGTNLDLMRPGISIYGLCPGKDLTKISELGFQPAASVCAQASLVKYVPAGSHIGYGCTYICNKNEWIITIPVGYADFYPRHLSNIGVVIRDKTGERCPVVGRVSMDAITVKVMTSDTEVGETFTLMTSDYDLETSAFGIARLSGTINNDLITRLQSRLPRYFTLTNDLLQK